MMMLLTAAVAVLLLVVLLLVRHGLLLVVVPSELIEDGRLGHSRLVLHVLMVLLLLALIGVVAVLRLLLGTGRTPPRCISGDVLGTRLWLSLLLLKVTVMVLLMCWRFVHDLLFDGFEGAFEDLGTINLVCVVVVYFTCWGLN